MNEYGTDYALQSAHEYSDFLLKRVVELEKTSERRLKDLLQATESLAMCRQTIAQQDLRIRQLIEEVNNLKYDNVRVKF